MTVSCEFGPQPEGEDAGMMCLLCMCAINDHLGQVLIGESVLLGRNHAITAVRVQECFFNSSLNHVCPSCRAPIKFLEAGPCPPAQAMAAF